VSRLWGEAFGIYVCVGGPEKDVIKSQIQRVFLLKLKNANGLLKGREPSKEIRWVSRDRCRRCFHNRLARQLTRHFSQTGPGNQLSARAAAMVTVSLRGFLRGESE
jgi:hypothetical protein